MKKAAAAAEIDSPSFLKKEMARIPPAAGKNLFCVIFLFGGQLAISGVEGDGSTWSLLISRGEEEAGGRINRSLLPPPLPLLRF